MYNESLNLLYNPNYNPNFYYDRGFGVCLVELHQQFIQGLQRNIKVHKITCYKIPLLTYKHTNLFIREQAALNF